MAGEPLVLCVGHRTLLIYSANAAISLLEYNGANGEFGVLFVAVSFPLMSSAGTQVLIGNK